jgi:N6-L-threonylcarbamoyladenine synthase
MRILAIETSCDDTSIALLKGNKLESNIVSSQVELHKKYGGVYPTLAKREHQKNLVPVLKKALSRSGQLCKKRKKDFSGNPERFLERSPLLLKKTGKFLSEYRKPKIDCIAVTAGPGLEPCLWAGINFAKALSSSWKVPLIPINHIEAHIISSFIGKNSKIQIPDSKKTFPALALVVSGGHTQLILMKKIGKYKVIGETRDDAAGECFDKIARILGLEYPGGPAIAAKAALFSLSPSRFSIKLPRPMISQKNYDFSFSGLKTAVLYMHKMQTQKKKASKEYIKAAAAEAQRAIVEVLAKKTLKAAKDKKAKTIILAGGVAANLELRKKLKEKIEKEMPGTKYIFPEKKYCTDNAAMVAAAAIFHFPKRTNVFEKISAQANLRIK